MMPATDSTSILSICFSDGSGSVSVMTRREIGDGAVVGPFAYIAPGMRVAPGTITGPFFAVRDDDDDDAGEG